MLLGLTGLLEEGQTYPLELKFKKAGNLKMGIMVMSIATRAHKAEPSS